MKFFTFERHMYHYWYHFSTRLTNVHSWIKYGATSSINIDTSTERIGHYTSACFHFDLMNRPISSANLTLPWSACKTGLLCSFGIFLSSFGWNLFNEADVNNAKTIQNHKRNNKIKTTSTCCFEQQISIFVPQKNPDFVTNRNNKTTKQQKPHADKTGPQF